MLKTKMHFKKKKKHDIFDFSQLFLFFFFCRIEHEPQSSKIFRSLTKQPPSCIIKKHVRNLLCNAN